MKQWKQKLQRYMLRPFIHMSFTRLILAFFILLLIDFLLASRAGRSLKPTLFLLGGVVFALLAWIAWLRLDGIKLPKPLMLRVNPRKKPARSYGDMIDYVDEKPEITFEDLDDQEKDLCILGADLLCCIVLIIASALS